jgi:hypothetical protein
MQLVSRKDLGYKDRFEGYVIFKDQIPVFQQHLYGDYYTVFWRGFASLDELANCLGDSVQEIGKRLREPVNSLNKGHARFVLGQEVVTVPFEIQDNPERLHNKKLLLDGSPELFAEGSQPVFARFDIESSLSLPIILWGDILDEADSDVGFSTTVELPAAVLELLQHTCRMEISDAELEEIRGHVLDHMPVLV